MINVSDLLRFSLTKSHEIITSLVHKDVLCIYKRDYIQCLHKYIYMTYTLYIRINFVQFEYRFFDAKIFLSLFFF